MNQAQFCTVSLQPYPNRTEHVNIGIVVWKHTGEIRLHLINRLNKVKCFAPNADLGRLREWEDGLHVFLRKLEIIGQQNQYDSIQQITGLRLSENFGFISYETDLQYAEKVTMMLNSLAEPESRKRQQREPTSRLNKQLKHAFTASSWIGSKQSDINKKLIVPRFRLFPGEDATAEFALKNDRLSVIETFDFRTNFDSNKRNEARAKALIYDLAYQVEEKTINGYAVIAGTIENNSTTPTVNLLKRYADQVLLFEDQSDMNFLMKSISEATGKPMLELPID